MFHLFQSLRNSFDRSDLLTHYKSTFEMMCCIQRLEDTVTLEKKLVLHQGEWTAVKLTLNQVAL